MSIRKGVPPGRQGPIPGFLSWQPNMDSRSYFTHPFGWAPVC